MQKFGDAPREGGKGVGNGLKETMKTWLPTLARPTPRKTLRAEATNGLLEETTTTTSRLLAAAVLWPPTTPCLAPSVVVQSIFLRGKGRGLNAFIKAGKRRAYAREPASATSMRCCCGWLQATGDLWQ